MPHVRHAAMAVTRPPPIPAPGSHRIGDRILHEALLASQLVMLIRRFETLVCRPFRRTSARQLFIAWTVIR